MLQHLEPAHITQVCIDLIQYLSLTCIIKVSLTLPYSTAHSQTCLDIYLLGKRRLGFW